MRMDKLTSKFQAALADDVQIRKARQGGEAGGGVVFVELIRRRRAVGDDEFGGMQRQQRPNDPARGTPRAEQQQALRRNWHAQIVCEVANQPGTVRVVAAQSAVIGAQDEKFCATETKNLLEALGGTHVEIVEDKD